LPILDAGGEKPHLARANPSIDEETPGMHIPGPTVIGWLSQFGNKAIEVARQGYNHELYRQSSVAVSAAGLQRKLSSKL
jgi:hypothetical protein